MWLAFTDDLHLANQSFAKQLLQPHLERLVLRALIELAQKVASSRESVVAEYQRRVT